MKKRQLVIAENLWDGLGSTLLARRDREELAFLLCAPARHDRATRLIVRDVHWLGPDDYIEQSGCYLKPKLDVVTEVLSRAQAGYSVIEVHSHPFDDGTETTFSRTDTDNMYRKYPPAQTILPAASLLGAVVLGRKTFDGLLWHAEEEVLMPIHEIRTVGSTIRTLPSTSGRHLASLGDGSATDWSAWDRQIIAFGDDVQASLDGLTVAVVGVGGIGSAFAQQAAYMGVGRLILVDPDLVERSNLNRLIGARPKDVGRRKVEVVAQCLREINPRIDIVTIGRPLQSAEAMQELKVADILVGCLDNDGGRYLLNRLSVQFCIPYLDCGTGIFVKDGAVSAAGGQLRLVRPEFPCLSCTGALDQQQIAAAMARPWKRQMREGAGYVDGARASQPSVVHLNGVIASLAADALMNLVCGYKESPPLLRYDAVSLKVEGVGASKSGGCTVCSPDGYHNVGDLQPLLPEAAAEIPAVTGIASS